MSLALVDDVVKKEEEERFSDPDDYVDDGVSDDEEVIAFDKKNRPVLDESFAAYLVIDNVPVVGSDKKEKLCVFLENRIRKLTTGFVSLELPFSTNGMTSGIAFVEFESASATKLAAQALHDHPFDRHHRFVVNTFGEVQQYLSVKEENRKKICVPENKEVKNLFGWMMDENGFDQFCVSRGNETNANVSITEVFLNSLPQSKIMMEREGFSEARPAVWSPLGTYLASFHQQGIALYGQYLNFHRKGDKRVVFSLPFTSKLNFVCPANP